MPSSSETTQLLIRWRNGDSSALKKPIPLVEKELREIARRYMRRERPDHTLQPTALVNEDFIRLIEQTVLWQNRAHFLAIAANIMRRILLNYARDQKRLKRGGGAAQVSLSEAKIVSREKSIVEVIALNDALDKLALFDERKSRVVELRYFGGLELKEIAEVLKVSEPTVRRDLDFAEA